MCGHCGCEKTRIIQIEEDIMAENQRYANQNRLFFEKNNIHSLNFVSSPGSGKTTFLVETIQMLNKPVYVIEGDQQTDHDKERIAKTGAPVVQINTGKGCHLEAHSVGHAIKDLAPEKNSFIFIENVGNLVCPALFDLGESSKVAILSVTEGEDKPLKYPYLFLESSLMIINKIDLLPYVSFHVDRCIEYARRINPKIDVIRVSATTGEGLDQWIHWLL